MMRFYPKLRCTVMAQRVEQLATHPRPPRQDVFENKHDGGKGPAHHPRIPLDGQIPAMWAHQRGLPIFTELQRNVQSAMRRSNDQHRPVREFRWAMVADRMHLMDCCR